MRRGAEWGSAKRYEAGVVVVWATGFVSLSGFSVVVSGTVSGF